jgi:hypothetical protein
LSTDTNGDDAILIIDADVPQNILGIRTITNLAVGESVLAIDARPADGKLYALTAFTSFTSPRIVTVDPNTGVATLVSALAADPADLTNPFIALSGTHFAIDFNPQADRLRVVSDTDQNLRININVAGGTALVTTDVDLAYSTPLGQGPKINAIAYTNNNAGATSTRLFDIDDANFKVAEQSPPSMQSTIENPSCYFLHSIHPRRPPPIISKSETAAKTSEAGWP